MTTGGRTDFYRVRRDPIEGLFVERYDANTGTWTEAPPGLAVRTLDGSVDVEPITETEIGALPPAP